LNQGENPKTSGLGTDGESPHPDWRWFVDWIFFGIPAKRGRTCTKGPGPTQGGKAPHA
jgi:hypothetical protein